MTDRAYKPGAAGREKFREYLERQEAASRRRSLLVQQRRAERLATERAAERARHAA